MEYLIGIDLGTSGTKTVLFDREGSVAASATVEYPLYQERNGWAEQDPQDWWNAACQTLREVMAQSGVDPKDVKGLGISGQMHGLVMLDKEGKVLRRSIIWCDQRTAKQCEEITQLVGKERLIQITANPALTGFTASKILWVRENEPQLYARCAHILLPKDYVRYRLTGEFATEVSDASGTQLLDVPKRQWSQEVLEKLQIDPAMLAKVYESPEITGEVTQAAAELTGLAPGTPVVGGAGDNAAAAVGTGVVEDGKAFTTIGTSGVVFAHTDKISIDPKGRVHTFCCAVPGAWHVMGVTQGAGLSLKWFPGQLLPGGERTSPPAWGWTPYVLIGPGGGPSPPLAATSFCTCPTSWGSAPPTWTRTAGGVLVACLAIHTKRDMLRAVMEGGHLLPAGTAWRSCGAWGSSSQRCWPAAAGGAPPCGGRCWADTYNCPVKTVKSKEGPALGVAFWPAWERACTPRCSRPARP